MSRSIRPTPPARRLLRNALPALACALLAAPLAAQSAPETPEVGMTPGVLVVPAVPAVPGVIAAPPVPPVPVVASLPSASPAPLAFATSDDDEQVLVIETGDGRRLRVLVLDEDGETVLHGGLHEHGDVHEVEVLHEADGAHDVEVLHEENDVRVFRVKRQADEPRVHVIGRARRGNAPQSPRVHVERAPHGGHGLRIERGPHGTHEIHIEREVHGEHPSRLHGLRVAPRQVMIRTPDRDAPSRFQVHRLEGGASDAPRVLHLGNGRPDDVRVLRRSRPTPPPAPRILHRAVRPQVERAPAARSVSREV